MRHPVTAVLLALSLSACPIGQRLPGPDAGDLGPVEQCGPFEIAKGLIDASKPWPGLACADFADLCDLHVESTVANTDTARAIDIVFVGDGYTEAQLADYQALVSQLIQDVRDPPQGFVARRAQLFNFHRVDVISKSSHAGNADRSDTALAGCVDIDLTGELIVEDRLAGLAATANVKDVDVIVAVQNTLAGTPNSSSGPALAQPAIVRINPLATGETLIHELGHAIFHLGDEYATQPACFTPPNLPGFTTADYLYDIANLSTEQSGKKWTANHFGSAVGGMDFRYCVFHPGLPCMMNEGTLPFCAVCLSAIDATLDAREAKNDGAPVCGIELASPTTPGYVQGTIEARAVLFDRNFPSRWSMKMDGAQIVQGDVPFWYQRSPASIDTTKLGNATHALTVECTDALGLSSSAQVNLVVHN